jgi:hypothetical protein
MMCIIVRLRSIKVIRYVHKINKKNERENVNVVQSLLNRIFEIKPDLGITKFRE